MDQVLVRIFTTGGILAPDDLSTLIKTISQLEVKDIRFGDRQEIIFKIDPDKLRYLKTTLYKIQYDYEIGEVTRHNVVTSYLSNNISPGTNWLKEESFLDILDAFDFTPKVRVNITDLKQDLVYSFTGDLNFVASDLANHWHVYFRNEEKGDIQYFPYTLHSEDVVSFIRAFEPLFLYEKLDFQEISTRIVGVFQDKLQYSDLPPRVRIAEFFNYEGLQQYKDKYWLGIYKRSVKFSLEELEGLCNICSFHRIGKIFITPWKTLIIKDIQTDFLMDWKGYLAKHGTSNRHALSELNWQLSDFDQESLELKTYLRREFSFRDISLNGVILALNNDFHYSFSHIIVQEKRSVKVLGKKFFTTYDIYVRNQFNPTRNIFRLAYTGVSKENLVTKLSKLIEFYQRKAFIDQANQPVMQKTVKQKVVLQDASTEKAYQCSDCMTVYFEEEGDPSINIAPHTKFEELPADYKCSLCEASKDSFVEVEQEDLSYQQAEL